MMNSSGPGSYRAVVSFSSSNLSPLAPPFKVDKSFPKPNSTNPVNFPDGPMYGACFDPAPGQFWNSSSSSVSVPQCVATEPVVTNTNCSSTAPNMYGYRDSQSSSSSVYYGSTNNVSSYDPFTYEPFPSSISSNNEEAAKPFYPPFVSPPTQKDGYLGLGVGSGSNYDLLSLPGSSHLGGHGAAPAANPKALSGDRGYKSKWGYFWNGLNDSENEKWADYAKGFVPKDLNVSNSSNKSTLFVDGSNKSQPFVDVSVRPFFDGSNNNHLFGDVSNKSHLKQGTYVTQDQGLHGQVPSVKDNCFDIFGGSYSLGNLGIDQQDCKSSSRCSRTSASASVSKESPHLQEPVPESVTSFGGYQKAVGSSPDDHFSQASFYMFGCAPSTANTFPKTATKFPNVDSCFTVESASSAGKLKSMGNDPANQSNSSAGYTSSYQMESQMPHDSRSRPSIRIRRPVPSFRAASSFEKLEIADGKLDDKVAYEKISTSPQLSHRLSLDGLNTQASDAEAVCSVEKHSVGSDGHNPAEDSPCWRGASSNRFSPFGQSESLASDGLLKKFDICGTLNSQDLQNKTNTSDLNNISAGKFNMLNLVEKPLVSDCTSNYNEDFGCANPKYRCFDLNAGDSLHFADECHASAVGCNTIDKSKTDLDVKSSPADQLILDTEISSARKISEAEPSEKGRNNTPKAIERFSGLPENMDSLSGSPSNMDNLLNPVPGNETSINSASEHSDSKIDVNVLLRTMMNLSEILSSHCSSYRTEIGEKHSVAIKQIVNNLNASMLIISGQTVPTSVLSSPDTYFQKEFPVVQMVNDAEALAASMKLGRTTDGFLDGLSLKDDRDTFGNINMTEAVKKLLSENLQEEEMDQQKLLYKNLWLEAEASLCVMTAKARFIRMKTDMKRAREEVKDEDNSKSCNFPADVLRAVESATKAKDSSSLDERPTITSQLNHIEEHNIPNSQATSSNIPVIERARSKETCFPSLHGYRPDAPGNDSNDSLTTSRINDVEACVMARYQILQNRVGCLDSLNYENKQYSGEHTCPSFDGSVTTTKANDLETSVFGGYQILKCLDESDYLNNEGKQLPGDENYLPDIDSSSPHKALQDSQMSNSLGVTDEREASVMARFRILQTRMDHLNSMVNGSAPVQQGNSLVCEDRTGEMGSSQQQRKIMITSFGPYPELEEDEDLNVFNINVNEQTVAPIVKTNKMSNVILEGWYDAECSSPEWEHVSKVDV